MAFAGAGGISMAAVANTTMQLSVPDQLRGRVMSVYTTTFAGSVPAGGLLMGFVASRWGTPLALVLGGVLSTVVGAAGVVWLRRIGARPVERPQERRESVPSGAGAGIRAGGDASSLTSARPR